MKGKAEKQRPAAQPDRQPAGLSIVPAPRPGWQRLTFSLRPDAPLTLELPADLSAAEARRLGHFLLAHATSE